MRKLLLAAALLAGGAFPAHAATILINDGSPYTYVVHNNSAGSGTSLNLTTMPGGYTVNYSSSSVLDAGNGNGVASVDGPFADLTIDPLGPIIGFSVIQFKLDEPTGRPVARDFDILLNFVGGGTQVFNNLTFPSNNKLDVLAGVGEVISSITFSGLRETDSGDAANFRDIKQVSFDAVFQAAVPEPASWAMLIAGFGLVGGAMRVRRRETALA